MKSLSLLGVLLLSSAVLQAQTLAIPSSNTAKTPANSVQKTYSTTETAAETMQKKETSPEYVVKNFNQNLQNNDDKKYDNSQQKAYSFKIINGEIVPDNRRSILISYEDYKINRSFDNWMRCSMRIYVLNDLTEKINNFSFKLHWPEISTTVQMNRLNPGVRTYKDIVLLGNGCLHLDKTPTIEVNRCRVKGMTQEQCADAVKWYRSR